LPVVCLVFLPMLSAYAQLPVTSGLVLHLEAGSGFNDNGGLPATWADQSPAANNMISGAGLAEPIQVPNSYSTGFTALSFDGVDDYFINSSLNNTLSDTQSTVFVVRIASNVRAS